MGCCGNRKVDDDLADIRPAQKWDYINLEDFKSRSCWTPFSYFLLYCSVIISFAVYGVDTFTAINLLAFQRWASQIKPKIPFNISKWIFAGCIIFSFVLLIYRWLRAWRVIKSGAIAQSYLDPIAVRLQSTRTGKGQGWRRFLVFADLTKSKKGADYVALFTYFNFEAWLRILVAEGPRQVINAMTLYEVLQIRVLPGGEEAPDEGDPGVGQFFDNIGALADQDRQQALILFAMLFTFVIWVFSVMSLLVSIFMYIFFLWHHIPSEDRSLKGYCKRKINTRLERIVNERVDKALAKGVVLQDRKRADLEPGFGPSKRVPTLPTLNDYPNDETPPPPPPTKPSSLSRTTTETTLPPYTSRPSTANTDRNGTKQRQPTLPGQSEDTSSLMGNAGGVGYSDPPYQPTLPPIDRQGTPLSLSAGNRTPTPQSRPPPGPGPRGPPPPGSAYARSMTSNGTSSPRPPPEQYRPFRAGTPADHGDLPSPSSTPGAGYRNFARPYAPSPSNEFARSTPPPRGGTAPPRPQQHPYPPSNNYF